MADKVSLNDKVTTTARTDWNGGGLASFVNQNTYYVQQIGGSGLPDERIVIGITPAPPKYPNITAAVHINTLTVVESANNPQTPETTPTEPLSDTPANPYTDKGEVYDTMRRLEDFQQAVRDAEQEQSDYLNGVGGGTSDSVVQMLDKREQADRIKEDTYVSLLDPEPPQFFVNPEVASFLDSVERQDPSIYQNSQAFPRAWDMKQTASGKQVYVYDYFMDYENSTGMNGLPGMRELTANSHLSVNIDIRTRDELTRYYMDTYNKYKLANPNDALSKTFSHVFFVRPDCNLFTSYGSKGERTLLSEVANLSEFYYSFNHSPYLLRQLTQGESGYSHEFSMFLSNKAKSLQIPDEYITTETYGTGLTGYKVAYGKHNVESRTAGQFSVHYVDDRDLNVYNLHKLWIDYISYVYRGRLSPRTQYILHKIIDYAACVYYIVCAEDGETVIFWSKYWGVFPTNAPSSTYSWSADNGGGIALPSFDIQYQYSWKEDLNPLSMVEFNTHSDKLPLKYVPHYNETMAGTGWTFGGAPFIETFRGGLNEAPYTFKLRFRPVSGIY